MDAAMTAPLDDARILAAGRAALATEASAVAALVERLDATFAAACRCLINVRGRVVVTGMGKSGHVGSKIAATLASTGTPAFFLHPAEAIHGDLGMITRDDGVIALSNSGETAEVLALVPTLRRLGIPVQDVLSMICPQWFISLFVNALPLQLVFKFWDVIFLEGSVAVFQVLRLC